jgi:hypothetical protein
MKAKMARMERRSRLITLSVVDRERRVSLVEQALRSKAKTNM